MRYGPSLKSLEASKPNVLQRLKDIKLHFDELHLRNCKVSNINTVHKYEWQYNVSIT